MSVLLHFSYKQSSQQPAVYFMFFVDLFVLVGGCYAIHCRNEISRRQVHVKHQQSSTTLFYDDHVVSFGDWFLPTWIRNSIGHRSSEIGMVRSVGHMYSVAWNDSTNVLIIPGRSLRGLIHLGVFRFVFMD